MVARLEAVTKRYGGLVAVDAVTLTVEAGQVFGLLGPNGSGKTTLFRLMLGLEAPDAGRLWMFGEELRTAHAGLRRRIGYVGDTPHFYDEMPVGRYLELFAALYGVPDQSSSSRRWLGAVELGGWWDAPLATLSHGMRQRVAICRALMHEPALLLLDEPTAGLDPQGICFMRELIVSLARAGTTVLLASHLISEVEKVCSHVGMLHRGRLVVAGTLPEVCQACGAATEPPDLESAYMAAFAFDASPFEPPAAS